MLRKIKPAAYLPLITFLLAYFLTTVLGNILYVTPIGVDWPIRSMPSFDWSQFHQPFRAGFWVLLLSPLIVTPILTIIVAVSARPLALRAADVVPEISDILFATVNILCLAYISYSLIRAGASAKLFAGDDPMDAVRNRFYLQSELGLPPRFILMSVMQFLSVYALVRSIRSGRAFWIIFASINIVAMLAFLILVNMKWPIILFELTIAATILVCLKRRALIATFGILALSVLTYFAISFLLLRINPSSDIASKSTPEIALSSPKPRTPLTDSDELPKDFRSIYEHPRNREPVPTSPPLNTLPFQEAILNLGIVALNRLAMTAPFYYDIFTTYGQVCGSFLDRVVLRRPGSCHPSIFVYAQMFPNDGFTGRGTAPAAHQLYEYARGGWLGAFVALVIGALVIGLYTACYFARKHDLFIAMFVMGIPASYMLSQLPIEATILSETGAAWWFAIIAINTGILYLKSRRTLLPS